MVNTKGCVMHDLSDIASTAALGVLVVAVLVIIKDYIDKWRKYRHIPTPPFPPLPLVGHLYRQRPVRAEFYSALSSRLQENYINKDHEVGCFFLGPTPLISVVGPNAAEVLLRSSKHTEKGFMYTFIHEWLRTGLLTSSGLKWARRRKLLTPTFHFSILKAFLEVMNEQASIFVAKLEKQSIHDNPVDIFQPMTLCALDIISETAMGTKINAQGDSKSDYVSAINSITELIWNRTRSPWIWWNWVYKLTPNGQAYYKALNTIHSFTRKVIESRMQEVHNDINAASRKRSAFLDLLLNSKEDGKPLSLQDIQEEVDTFMFEGHDTTAAGMSWAIFLIGNHRDVQTKMQIEMDEVLGLDTDRCVTMDDLKKLKYLDLVLKECLRQLPSVPIIGRMTSCECEMDGYKIPAGTQCLVFPQLINNLEKYWPDPNKFDPERFTPDKFEGQHPYAYIPFSAGPRNCIGQKFATVEEKVVLVHLFRKFDVTSCDRREDLQILGDVILRPGSGVNVKLTARTQFYPAPGPAAT